MKNQIKRLLALSLLFAIQGGAVLHGETVDQAVAAGIARVKEAVKDAFLQQTDRSELSQHEIIDVALRKMDKVSTDRSEDALRSYGSELNRIADDAIESRNEPTRAQLDFLDRLRQPQELEAVTEAEILEERARTRKQWDDRAVAYLEGKLQRNRAADAVAVFRQLSEIDSDLRGLVGATHIAKQSLLRVVSEKGGELGGNIRGVDANFWMELMVAVKRVGDMPNLRKAYKNGQLHAATLNTICEKLGFEK